MYNLVSDAEVLFNQSKGFIHLYTTPIEDNVVFASESDLLTANNLIAMASSKYDCKILAMAIMSNHLHFILEGLIDDCLAFFENFRLRLQRVMARQGRGGLVCRMLPGTTVINNLTQLRNEIAYVIRNPFVARTDVNPMAYKWCSSNLYFNPLLDTQGTPASRLTGRSLRSFLHARSGEDIPENILVREGMALPSSFIDYKRAESMFDNARQFIMWLFKNVEGQVETAIRLGEIPHLNDYELFSLAVKTSRLLFKVNSIKELSAENKMKLAIKLKRDYGSSNPQIARCVNMPLSVINRMFPLSRKE